MERKQVLSTHSPLQKHSNIARPLDFFSCLTISLQNLEEKFMQQMKKKKLVMFFYFVLNLEYLKKVRKKDMCWEGRVTTEDLKAFFPLCCSGSSGFSKERPRTFQSHFRACKVNTHCKLFIFTNKGDFLFLPKGHLYP